MSGLKKGDLVKFNGNMKELIFSSFSFNDMGLICDNGEFWGKNKHPRDGKVYLVLIKNKMQFLNIYYLEKII